VLSSDSNSYQLTYFYSFIQKSFEEAKQTVHQLLQDGGDDNSCRTLAKATEAEVTASVNAQQKIIDGMSKGESCDLEGQGLIDKAEKDLKSAQTAEGQAAGKVQKLKTQKINFGDFQFDQLTEGQCSSFFNQDVWKQAKADVAAAKKAYTQAQATTKAAKTAVENAKKEAKKLARECRCKAFTALEKAVKTANDKAKHANTKAWVKATHLRCVLDGKDPSSCTVGSIPTVKMVKVSDEVANSCKTYTWDAKGKITGYAGCKSKGLSHCWGGCSQSYTKAMGKSLSSIHVRSDQTHNAVAGTVCTGCYYTANGEIKPATSQCTGTSYGGHGWCGTMPGPC